MVRKNRCARMSVERSHQEYSDSLPESEFEELNLAPVPKKAPEIDYYQVAYDEALDECGDSIEAAFEAAAALSKL